MFIIGFLLGGCVGVLVACAVGAHGKEEAHIQGYKEGLKVGSADVNREEWMDKTT